MKGYAGKFLEVDLTSNKVAETRLPEETLRRYIGGRGLASRILWDRIGEKWDSVDPLGPENILLILTGPLTGYFPGGRICVSGKSPQSNGIVGSTVAGEFGIELKCAGYDGIIVSGEADKPTQLFIFDSHVELRDASHIWGLEGKETFRRLVKEGREELRRINPRFGEWKDPSILYIGPAGENKVRVAAVMAKWTHAAGYGGYGAVMGSKKLKAITVKGSGPLPEVADMEGVRRLIGEVCDELYKNELFRRWGTGHGGYYYGNQTSSEPVRNWQEEWHDVKDYGVDRFDERVWVKRFWGDYGCPTTCLKVAMPTSGPLKGAVSDNPDYELQAYVGTNLGVFTPEGNTYLSARVDDLGICGINGGNVLGFAAELYQRGLLTKDELEGIDLEWGNVEAFAKLLEKIAYRKGIGDVLAEGTYRAALKLSKEKGEEVLRYAVQSKGIAIGAHGNRSTLDYPSYIAYACSVQGGDHTSIAHLPLNHGNSELTIALYDSAVICWFNAWTLPETLVWDFINKVTGWNISGEEWYDEMARRIINIQRAALLIGGPDLRWKPRENDENPPRFYEPLPSGPKKGRGVDRREFEEMRMEYYSAMGWDENGIPKGETLERLGLGEVDRVLKDKLGR